MTVGIGVLSLIGWAFGSTIITGMSNRYVPIAPSTALCFSILSASFLFYLLHSENSTRRMVAALCAFLTLLICSILLISFFMGITFEAEHLGFTLPKRFALFPIGHMSPMTATNFIAASIGVLLLVLPKEERQLYKDAASFLAVCIISVGFIVIIGYLYGTPILYGGHIIPVAFPTAMAFVFLGMGLMTASGPDVLPARFFKGPTVRSRLIRVFLPTIIVFTLINGYLYKMALSAATNPALITSLIAIFSATIIGIIISKLSESIGDEIDQLHSEREKIEETLKASERKYRQLIDTLQEGIWAIDKDGVTTFVNDATAEMLGYTIDEMLGKYLFTFMDERAVEIAKKYIERRKQGTKKLQDFEFIRKDGIRISTTFTASSIFDDQGNYAGVVAGVMDISERKQKEAQIEVNLKRMTALRDIDMAITGSLDLRVTLHVILDQVTTLLNVDAAVVLLLDQHSLYLEYAAGRGFQTTALRHTRLRIGEGHAGRAALERHIIIANIRDEVAYLEQSPLLGKEGFLTYIVVPLISKGHVKGALELFHREIITPDKGWSDFLDALAGQAAIAIDNASLFNDLARSNIDLMLAYDTTLAGWSRALDMRDKETEGHSQRVTEMTVRLAKALGIGNDEITHIRRGAMLHDIGKMGTSDSILLKPGHLTDEEWKIMHQHPVLADKMLQPINFLRLAREIPVSHHEKWDGTGYPKGLKGEGIPLAARIFAVVDVWDALNSERPYRPAWQQEKVVEYIREQAGKHFDPKVVEAFLELMRSDGADILLKK